MREAGTRRLPRTHVFLFTHDEVVCEYGSVVPVGLDGDLIEACHERVFDPVHEHFSETHHEAVR